MDKQYYVLSNHKDKGISWKKGDVILLDPDVALPYVGVIITPLYSAIKAGLYQVDEPEKPLAVQIIEEVKEAVTPDEEPALATPAAPDSNDVVVPKSAQKKLLQNKLQAQIAAKKAELAKQKDN